MTVNVNVIDSLYNQRLYQRDSAPRDKCVNRRTAAYSGKSRSAFDLLNRYIHTPIHSRTQPDHPAVTEHHSHQPTHCTCSTHGDKTSYRLAPVWLCACACELEWWDLTPFQSENTDCGGCCGRLWLHVTSSHASGPCPRRPPSAIFGAGLQQRLKKGRHVIVRLSAVTQSSEDRAVRLGNHGNSSSSSATYVTWTVTHSCIPYCNSFAPLSCGFWWLCWVRAPLEIHASFLRSLFGQLFCSVALIAIRPGTIELPPPHSSVRQWSRVVFILPTESPHQNTCFERRSRNNTISHCM